VATNKILAEILLTEIIGLCFLTTYFRVDNQSTVTLLVFNILFLSVFLQLAGSGFYKMALLAAGNMFGTVWNYCFHQLLFTAVTPSTPPNMALNMFYTVAYPSLNSLWVLAFWSLSLSALCRPKLEVPKNVP